MGYVNTKPEQSVSDRLYPVSEAIERLRRESLCGLVVSKDQNGWHLCHMKVGHGGNHAS